MDKPLSLSVKDYLIRILAVKMLTSEKTIEAVIDHQYQSTNQALIHHKSIEVSGFARFIFNQKKADKKMMLMLQKRDYYRQAVLDNPASTSWKNKLNNTLAGIEILKPKINDSFSDIRRLEE